MQSILPKAGRPHWLPVFLAVVRNKSGNAWHIGLVIDRALLGVYYQNDPSGWCRPSSGRSSPRDGGEGVRRE